MIQFKLKIFHLAMYGIFLGLLSFFMQHTLDSLFIDKIWYEMTKGV